ncbi:winged helix-turn-helix domain-containing protein [Pseudobacteriovorax antillogorgiicola]|uniref:Transcriptional regulatory protein, C terminal n=1 Tax=Pseudobacteriovorax antillogorgiicola TaxID=1513793 RepID=A0A1Y6CA81_9BACT|nr:winged helix-turn-helix domain-containing protein [Pseudobacteriovorax antillogorgiicola]TCS49023.1 transcriptional regulator [Pseudobacteriovorax antillogorgiicola]SMF52878.1 Transcriptional regulatory protein, C terminal [Pseudobacteriovorax antillogorgiicola]
MIEFERAILECDGLKLDLENYEAFHEERSLHLTLSEFRVLSALLWKVGVVRSRQQLLRTIAPNHKIIPRNIDVHIQALRKKLGPMGQAIHTVRGLGYKWNSHSQEASPTLIEGFTKKHLVENSGYAV